MIRYTTFGYCRWLLVLAVLATLLAGCSRETPDMRLRASVEQMHSALEERDPAGFMEYVAADFSGNGGMDRAALHNLLRAQLLANARIGATLGPLQVQLHDDHATVRFHVVLTGSDNRVLPERAGGYSVTSGWRDEDGHWRAYYADWRAADE